jgi:hypothetical protein
VNLLVSGINVGGRRLVRDGSFGDNLGLNSGGFSDDIGDLAEKLTLPVGERFDRRNISGRSRLVVTNNETLGDGVRDDAGEQSD